MGRRLGSGSGLHCADANGVCGGYRCYVPVGDGLIEIGPDRIATLHLQREYGTNDVILAARPMDG